MREDYNFEYWKDDRRRLQFSVIRGTSYRYLWHEEVELMLSLSGELEYFAGGRRYHLKKGDMLFFDQNCGHSIISKGADNRTVSLKLHPLALADQGFGICTSQPCFCVTQGSVCHDEDLCRIRKMIAAVYFYLKEEDGIFDRAAEILAVLIFVDILRRYGMVRQLEGDEAKTFVNHERMGAIQQYIMEHLTESITLQDVAGAAGYNKTYLSGQFKQWTGFRLSDHLKQMRIQKAIGMLEDQRYTLTEIALECGFSDHHSFSACMLQYCGRRPQEYREQIAGSGDGGGLKRHFAKYPDGYIEACFKELEGNGSGETDRDRYKEAIAVHANEILRILGKTDLEN